MIIRRFLTGIFTLMCTFALAGTSAFAAEKCDLKIGVTLHPYYSWVKNIVGDTAEVIPIVPSGADPHSYRPNPKDMAVMNKLDVLVINGMGHDEFVKPMLKAVNRKDLIIINPNKGVPLIPVQSHHYAFEKDEGQKVAYNSHTYISITTSIPQIQNIATELEKLCPQDAELYKKNTRAYIKRLRMMLADALKKLSHVDASHLRIATVHDGYAYLFQELGVKVVAVVQPRHGIEPSPRQLEDTIKRIKRAKVNILFAELDYNKKYVDIIYKETGCRIYSLSHISNGEYTADFYEKNMKRNLDTVVRALTEATADEAGEKKHAAEG